MTSFSILRTTATVFYKLGEEEMLRAFHLIPSPVIIPRTSEVIRNGGGRFSPVSTSLKYFYSYLRSLTRALTSLPLIVFRESVTTSVKPFRTSASSGSNRDGVSSSSCPSEVSLQQYENVPNIKFCQWCGGEIKLGIPHGEENLRAICTICGKITYHNPKMVVGCLIEHKKKILLCKRKIEPSYGLWTIPSGYLEFGESTLEGAIRETWEEANAEVEVVSPFAQLDIPLIGQTYLIFLARLKRPHFSPGQESSECRLYALDEIPFDSLAFSSILISLKLFVEDVKLARRRFHYGTINKSPDTHPSDLHAYTWDNHLQC